jgi:hypothetical protein
MRGGKQTSGKMEYRHQVEGEDRPHNTDFMQREEPQSTIDELKLLRTKIEKRGLSNRRRKTIRKGLDRTWFP